ncbi:MAG: class I SAM-dependent methyltransferase, partial [Hyphomonas sp.]
ERQKLASEIKGEVAKLSGAVAAVPQALEPKIKAASDATEKLSADLASVSQRITALDTERQKLASEIKGEVAKLSGAVAAVPQALEPKIKAASDATDKLSADLASVSQRITALDTERQKLASEITGLLKQIEAGQASDEALKRDLKSLEEQRASLQTVITETSEKVKAAEGRLAATEKWSRFDNAAWFQHFNRRLTKQHTEILDKEWRRRLSVPMAPATLGYMASRACEIEGRLEGRLATSIEDILLRLLVARAVKGKSVDVLEIGTLFGTGAAIMFDALDGHYEKIHFTLLDPLEGYYHGAQSDILTGQPVNEDVVRKNFSRAGMREDQYTLIKHLSTEPEAMELAAARKYDVLVIDGDHSYAGVKTDFENYAGLVRVGGYIIFDDYDSPDWPDVKAYVDAELGDHAFAAPVGTSWRTAVYRVVKAPMKPAASPVGRAGKSKSAARTDTGPSDQ